MIYVFFVIKKKLFLILNYKLKSLTSDVCMTQDVFVAEYLGVDASHRNHSPQFVYHRKWKLVGYLLLYISKQNQHSANFSLKRPFIEMLQPTWSSSGHTSNTRDKWRRQKGFKSNSKAFYFVIFFCMCVYYFTSFVDWLITVIAGFRCDIYGYI